MAARGTAGGTLNISVSLTLSNPQSLKNSVQKAIGQGANAGISGLETKLQAAVHKAFRNGMRSAMGQVMGGGGRGAKTSRSSVGGVVGGTSSRGGGFPRGLTRNLGTMSAQVKAVNTQLRSMNSALESINNTLKGVKKTTKQKTKEQEAAAERTGRGTAVGAIGTEKMQRLGGRAGLRPSVFYGGMPSSIPMRAGGPKPPSMRDLMKQQRAAAPQAPGGRGAATGGPGVAHFGGGKGVAERFRSVFQFTIAARVIGSAFSAISKSLSTIKNADKELAELNKVMDNTVATSERLKQSAVGIGKAFGQSIPEVLAAFKIFAQQGLNVDKIESRAKAVAMAANVTTLSQQEAAEVLTAGLKVFSKDIKTPIRMLDSFANVESKNAVTAGDMAQALRRVGSTAESVGVNFHELNAIVTTIQERTRRGGAEVGTSLRFIFRKIFSKSSLNLMDQLGIKTRDSTGELRRAFDVIKDVAGIFPNLSRQQKLQVATTIAGTRRFNSFLALMEGFPKVGTVVEQSTNSQGVAMEKQSRIMSSVNKQMDKTVASFEAFSMSIGEGLIGPFKALLKVMQAILDVGTKISSLKLFGKEGGGIGGFLATGAVGLGAGKIAKGTAKYLLPNFVSRAAGGAAAGGAFSSFLGAAGGVGTAFSSRKLQKLMGRVSPTGQFGAQRAAGSSVQNLLQKQAVGQTAKGAGRGLLGRLFGAGASRGIGALFAGGAAAGTWLTSLGAGAKLLVIAFGKLLITLAAVALAMKGISWVVNRITESAEEEKQRKGITGRLGEADRNIQTVRNMDRTIKALFGPKPGKVKEDKDTVLGLTDKIREAAAKGDQKEVDKLQVQRGKFIDSIATDLAKLGSEAVEMTESGKAVFKGKLPDTREELEKFLRKEVTKVRSKEFDNLSEALLIDAPERIDEFLTDPVKAALRGFRKNDKLRKGLTHKLDKTWTADLIPFPPFIFPKRKMRATPLSLTEEEKAQMAEKTTPGREGIKAIQQFFGGRIREMLSKATNKDFGKLEGRFRELAEEMEDELGSTDFKNMARAMGAQITDSMSSTAIQNELAQAFLRSVAVPDTAFAPKDKFFETAVNSLQDAAAEGFESIDFKKLGKGDLTEGLRIFKEEKARTGHVIKATSEDGRQALVSVVKNLDDEGTFRAVMSMADGTTRSFSSLEAALNSLGKTAQATAFDASTLSNKIQSSLKEDEIISGFAAGFVDPFKTITDVKIGAGNISEVGSELAGIITIAGGQKGDKGLADRLSAMVRTTSESQTRLRKDIADKGGELEGEANVERVKKVRSLVEVMSVLRTTFLKLGSSVQNADRAFRKLRADQISKRVEREMGGAVVTGATGGMGELPKVELPKFDEDLSPIERAAKAVGGESFKDALDELNRLQSEFKIRKGAILDLKVASDSVGEFVDNIVSKDVGDRLDPELFSAFLDRTAELPDHIKERLKGGLSEETLSNVLFGGEGIGKGKEEITRIIQSQVFAPMIEKLKQQAGSTEEARTALEKMIVSTVSLGRIAAKTAEQIQAIKDVPTLTNVAEALGQGPFGRRGAGAADMIQARRGAAAGRLLDFSEMNQFEAERRRIQLLGSPQARSGSLRFFDKMGTELKPLTRQQKALQLAVLKQREIAARREETRKPAERELEVRGQQTTSAIVQIQKLLRQGLVPKDKIGAVKDVLDDLYSDTRQSSKTLITGNRVTGYKTIDRLGKLAEEIGMPLGDTNTMQEQALKNQIETKKAMFGLAAKSEDEAESVIAEFKAQGGQLKDLGIDISKSTPEEQAKAIRLNSKLATAGNQLRIIGLLSKLLSVFGVKVDKDKQLDEKNMEEVKNAAQAAVSSARAGKDPLKVLDDTRKSDLLKTPRGVGETVSTRKEPTKSIDYPTSDISKSAQGVVSTAARSISDATAKAVDLSSNQITASVRKGRMPKAEQRTPEERRFTFIGDKQITGTPIRKQTSQDVMVKTAKAAESTSKAATRLIREIKTPSPITSKGDSPEVQAIKKERENLTKRQQRLDKFQRTQDEKTRKRSEEDPGTLKSALEKQFREGFAATVPVVENFAKKATDSIIAVGGAVKRGVVDPVVDGAVAAGKFVKNNLVDPAVEGAVAAGKFVKKKTVQVGRAVADEASMFSSFLTESPEAKVAREQQGQTLSVQRSYQEAVARKNKKLQEREAQARAKQREEFERKQQETEKRLQKDRQDRLARVRGEQPQEEIPQEYLDIAKKARESRAAASLSPVDITKVNESNLQQVLNSLPGRATIGTKMSPFEAQRRYGTAGIPAITPKQKTPDDLMFEIANMRQTGLSGEKQAALLRKANEIREIQTGFSSDEIARRGTMTGGGRMGPNLPIDEEIRRRQADFFNTARSFGVMTPADEQILGQTPQVGLRNQNLSAAGAARERAGNALAVAGNVTVPTTETLPEKKLTEKKEVPAIQEQARDLPKQAETRAEQPTFDFTNLEEAFSRLANTATEAETSMSTMRSSIDETGTSMTSFSSNMSKASDSAKESASAHNECSRQVKELSSNASVAGGSLLTLRDRANETSFEGAGGTQQVDIGELASSLTKETSDLKIEVVNFQNQLSDLRSLSDEQRSKIEFTISNMQQQHEEIQKTKEVADRAEEKATSAESKAIESDNRSAEATRKADEAKGLASSASSAASSAQTPLI